jgi:hypothetical protein
MEIFGNNLGAKKGKKEQTVYSCEKCTFKCFKKYSWDRHLLTLKHSMEMNGNDLEIEKGQKGQNKKKIICENCNKIFQTNTGLWKHKKKCNKLNNNNTIDVTNKDELILQLIKQNTEVIKENSEIKNIMMKVLENGTHNTNNSHNNNTNSHNKTFNLQFFLNETCKDAMNIMDFVDSIKLQLSDLESVGKLGYVEGISNIIVKNLKELDVTERPVHCTDKKREVLYIKDQDKWEKEDDDKNKIRKVIKKVASKNSLLIPKFKEVHPDCIKSISPFSDQYNKLIIESMGGSGDNDLEKEDKIIRNITKNIIIHK